MKKIGIIGPNVPNCSKELYDFGVKLGEAIAAPDRVIVCGGRPGFMEAVCRGVKQWPGTFDGQTVGILPECKLPYFSGQSKLDIFNNSGHFVSLQCYTCFMFWFKTSLI